MSKVSEMAPTVEVKPLRKCRVCGLEAHSLEDLDQFIKDKECQYSRRNFCKNCSSIQRKKERSAKPLMVCFYCLKQRCYNPNNPSYKNYGGRGITVCDEWRNDKEAFIKWALTHGFKKGLTIDRIDNDGNYEPQNCRWATNIQQQCNRRGSVTNWKKYTRICCKCKIEKPIDQFSKSAYDPLGYRYACKECKNKVEREYYRRKKLKKIKTA